MENEIIEETLPENTPDSVEGEENSEVLSPDVLPDEEIVESSETSSPDIPQDETGGDAAVLDPENVLPEGDASLDPAEEGTEEVTPEGEMGETEDETIYEMENGNEDFYNSVSNNDAGGGSVNAGASAGYNVTNYYITEVQAEEVIPLWENDISNFSTSEMLLFLIFLLLLVRFIHDIFKGSHWLKG